MPLRLDLALVQLHPGMSRRKARAVIEKGQVTLDGLTVREPGRHVPAAAVLHWDPHAKALPRARCRLPILHEDESLLVVDKPAGLLSVPTAPGARDEDTALARVSAYARHRRPRQPFAAAVHRLDRDTSGALCFALTREARAALRALFREHRIERRYEALVAGSPGADEGAVDLPLHEGYVSGRRRVARAGEPARAALTRYRVVERFSGAARLEVRLETGRQHQIRVHLASLGLPVLGDAVYGARGPRRPSLAVDRQMLHARRLGFVHPLTGQPVKVESPLPDDFKRALAALRASASTRGRGAKSARPSARLDSGRRLR